MAKNFETVSVGIKLDGKNFSVWSRLILIAVGSREKLDHLEGNEEPPKYSEPNFKEWQTTDYTVFSWLIQNMEPRLVMQFAQHKTAKGKWRSLGTTFEVRADPFQVYDLEVRTNKLNQGTNSLEDYWAELQNLWVNIDTRKSCPYACCEKTINTYRKETETKRLYQFLSGLDDRYDGLRRELLKENPEPTAEDAFDNVKQEENHTKIWKPAPNPGIGSRFEIRHGAHPPPQHHPHRGQPPRAPPPSPHRGQPP